jgi:tRNA(Met) cytidine acetyltransferase
VGFRRDHASGEHSVMMLTPLNKQGEEVFRIARTRMCQDFPHWLSDALHELDWQVASELLHDCDVELPGSIIKNDQKVCMFFADGARSYEDCIASLWRMSVVVLAEPDNTLSKNDCLVLFARVLQKRSWAQVSSLSGLKGRAEVLSALRSAVSHFKTF